MKISFRVAEILEKHTTRINCNHVWAKELYLGTKTGDYRCIKCGETVSELSVRELKLKNDLAK